MNAKRETTQTEKRIRQKRGTNTRERRIKRKASERKYKLWRVLKLFCASVLELCSTEVESFLLIKSSQSVDYALQFGKACNRILVGRKFCNTFILIRDSGLCLSVKKSLQRTNPSFRLNQLYKSFRLTARLLLEPE